MVQLASAPYWKRGGRYGYRRVTALLRAEGWRVNHKRIERLWRQEGLKVPQKQPKRRRLWLNDGATYLFVVAYQNTFGATTAPSLPRTRFAIGLGV